MNYLKALTLMMLFMGSLAGAEPYAEFEGRFEQVRTDRGCESVFDQLSYQIKFFLVGPNYRTIVMNLSREERDGFFQGINFVSNFGYDNDYVFEKTLASTEGDYKVKISGFVTKDVTLSSFEVDHVESGCKATAELSGFSR